MKNLQKIDARAVDSVNSLRPLLKSGSGGVHYRGETSQPRGPFRDCFALRATTMMSAEGGTVGAMKVTNGLYSIQIEMTDGGLGRATGVIMLFDGKIAGGDSYFYYTGSYTADRGKWRGELITNEHTKSAGAGGRVGGGRRHPGR